MNLKILLIVNPKAGKANIRYIPKVKKNLEKLNYDVQLIYTTYQKNATHIINNYKDDYNILIICGGDGTLNEAIQGIYNLKKDIPIGYIPIGTTNDFCKSLNVSFDKENISTQIKKYKIKKVDLGIFNKKIFVYSVTFGIFSKTSYETSSKIKNKIGRLAYIFSGIKEIFNYKTYDLKVRTSEKNIKGEFIFGSISNSKYIGGFHIFRKKNIDLGDGIFEVLLVKKPKNFVKLLKLIVKILTGNLNDENIYYFETQEIYLESEDEIKWAIDGEYGGNSKKASIYNVKKFVNFLIP